MSAVSGGRGLIRADRRTPAARGGWRTGEPGIDRVAPIDPVADPAARAGRLRETRGRQRRGAERPAVAVATLVDVSGLVIYFGVAAVILRGTLL